MLNEKRTLLTRVLSRAGYHIIISRVDKDTIRPELDALVKDWGITSLKCFTTYDALRLSDHDLMWLMLEARRLGVTTVGSLVPLTESSADPFTLQMMHAESGDIIAFLTEKLEERGMTAPSFHGQSRLPIAEGEATTRAIVLAELVQTPVLFVHVSAAVRHDRLLV